MTTKVGVYRRKGWIGLVILSVGLVVYALGSPCGLRIAQDLVGARSPFHIGNARIQPRQNWMVKIVRRNIQEAPLTLGLLPVSLFGGEDRESELPPQRFVSFYALDRCSKKSEVTFADLPANRVAEIESEMAAASGSGATVLGRQALLKNEEGQLVALIPELRLVIVASHREGLSQAIDSVHPEAGSPTSR